VAEKPETTPGSEGSASRGLTGFWESKQTFQEIVMAQVCVVTGKRPMSGNNVSHANNKTRRVFNPNLCDKRFWSPSRKRWVKLRITAKGIKIINVRGIDRVLDDLTKRGVKF